MTSHTAEVRFPFDHIRLRLAVGIATAGRCAVLSETLVELSRQARCPDVVFVCPAASSDYDRSVEPMLPFPVRVVEAPRGLTAQRNAILDAAQAFDVMIFLDDDFFPHSTYIAVLERCLVAHPYVVAASGWVIADGVKGPGLCADDARGALRSVANLEDDPGLVDQYNTYGCNMCVRLAPIFAHDLRFDENLPIYGWLEDVDFCRRLARYGRVVKNVQMIGVHLGTKGGRTSGVRFGYSQVANPLYIWRKGSTDLRWAIRHMGRNLLANLRQLPMPEPWVDRRGRVKGNFLALRDLISGRLDPKRILDFD